MVERLGQTFAQQQVAERLAKETGDPIGQLRGEEVIKEKSIQSLVADSLEEVTFSVAEKVESVDVQEVEIEDLAGDVEDRIKKIAKLQDELEGARGRLDSKKLQELLAALRQSGGNPDDVLKHLAERYPDVTDQYAALDEAMEETGRKSGDADLHKTLKKASAALWGEHQTEIVAGLHAMPAAERFAHGDVEQFQAMREAYRDQVIEQPTILGSLRKLRERFGDDRLNEQIKFLVAAAGHDVDALVSSVDKEQLGQMIGELSRLELIGSMRAQAGRIVQRMDKRFGTTGGRGEWDLLQDSMQLMEDKWVGSQKVEALSDSLPIGRIDSKIYFVRELNAFFRDMPIKAYDDLEARTRVLDASQEALDHLVEREEEEEL